LSACLNHQRQIAFPQWWHGKLNSHVAMVIAGALVATVEQRAFNPRLYLNARLRLLVYSAPNFNLQRHISRRKPRLSIQKLNLNPGGRWLLNRRGRSRGERARSQLVNHGPMLIFHALAQRFGSEFLGSRKFRIVTRSPVEYAALLVYRGINGRTVRAPVLCLHVVDLIAHSHVGVKPRTHGLAISSGNQFFRLFERINFWEFI
jgi:hypothetical protein